MPNSSQWLRPIQSSFLAHQYETLGRPHWFFQGTGIEATSHFPPLIPLPDYVRIVGNMVTRGPDRSYYIDLLDIGLPLYRGGLEIALRYAPTPRDALMLLMKHAGHRHGYLRYGLEPDGPHAWRLKVVPSFPLGDATAPLIETPLLNAHRLVCRMVGLVRVGARLSLRHAEHAHADRLRYEFADAVGFGSPMDALSIPIVPLDRPNLMYDPQLWLLGLRRCEEETRAITKGLGVKDVRRAIDIHLTETGKVPRLTDVALRLGMADRTLLRRIRAQGLTYRAMIDDLRRHRCDIMLATGNARIIDVSEALGFSDDRSFRRAFRRWNGSALAKLPSAGQ